MSAALRNVAVLVSALVLQGGALAQDFPGRPVTLVVPTSNGTSNDVLARILGPKLSERWKQPVIVENRAGASGSIAADFVSKSAPTGTTLLVTTAAFAMVPPLLKNLPYDPVRDFSPVGMLVLGSFAFTVNPQQLNVRNFNEFLQEVRARPGKYTYGSPGNGTAHHMGMELMKQHFGLDILHVPYKGAGGMMTDLIGGQVHMVLMPIPAAMPTVRGGKIRLIAVTGRTRSPAAPDTATFREQGSDYMDRVDGWTGVFAPAATPRALVARINQDFRAVLEQREVQELLTKDGGTTLAISTPEEFAEQLKVDIARWTKLAADAKITAD
jgi:tripartite-type tricarboxylate transporter receptor subunit TctC